MSAAVAMEKRVTPLLRTAFGLSQHMNQQFQAIVPPGTNKEDLESPRFWEHVQTQLRLHDEIRVVAEDSSMVAYLIVVAKAGNQAYTRVMWGTDLAEVDTSEISQRQSRYIVKMRGRQQWCVVDVETNRNIKQNIATKSVAERELEEYLQALSR